MSGRHWSVGFSALCPHLPLCANIYDTESRVDITFPCAGLSRWDALTIVAAVNAAGKPMADVDAELQREQARVEDLLRRAGRL